MIWPLSTNLTVNGLMHAVVPVNTIPTVTLIPSYANNFDFERSNWCSWSTCSPQSSGWESLFKGLAWVMADSESEKLDDFEDLNPILTMNLNCVKLLFYCCKQSLKLHLQTSIHPSVQDFYKAIFCFDFTRLVKYINSKTLNYHRSVIRGSGSSILLSSPY